MEEKNDIKIIIIPGNGGGSVKESNWYYWV